MNYEQKQTLVGTIPDQSIIDNAIGNKHGDVIHVGDLVLVLTDETWKYGIFLYQNESTKKSLVHLEAGKLGSWKEIPMSCVRKLKQ